MWYKIGPTALLWEGWGENPRERIPEISSIYHSVFLYLFFSFSLFVCLFFGPTCFACFWIPLPHLSQEKSKAGHFIGIRLSSCKFELDSEVVIL